MRLRRKVVGAVVVCCLATRGVAAQQRSSSLSDRDATIYAALLAMTDTRKFDAGLVDGALASRSTPLRAAATLAIGQVGADRGIAGVARLRTLLIDKALPVAANAAYALGLLRDSASVPALSAALATDHEVAREAAWALGEIGGPGRRTITAALGTHHPDDVTVQLLLAAAKLRPIPLAAVRPLLRTVSPPVTWAAAYAIARSAGGVRDLIDLDAFLLPSAAPRGPEILLRTIPPYTDRRAAPARTRAEIARGLAKSAAGDSLASRAFAVLSRLIHDPDSHVRINAARSVGTYGPMGKALLVDATRDTDANVRVAAAQSFGTVLTRESTEFPALLAADTALVYRASLLASATKAGLRPPELARWATNKDWKLRAAVAGAEGDSLDRAFAISRAAPLTRDADPRVREAAYAALAPPSSMQLEDSVHALLISGLRDPDFYVRATVIGALADRPSSKDLSAVLESYAQAGRDSANDARLAAIQYVSTLWKRDSSSFTQERRAQLAQLPIPSDPLERAAGKDVPAFAKWRSVLPSRRPMAWYQEVVRTTVAPVLSGKPVTATIVTQRGPIRLELFGADAPITVWNFLGLARSGYYRNTRFHRVVPNFVAQDGDPRDDGNGGPGYAIRDEMNRQRYERGAVGMALSGPDTGGSQYFITHSPQPHLDGHYTVFGRVIAGFDVLDRIVQGDLISRIDTR